MLFLTILYIGLQIVTSSTCHHHIHKLHCSILQHFCQQLKDECFTAYNTVRLMMLNALIAELENGAQAIVQEH